MGFNDMEKIGKFFTLLSHLLLTISLWITSLNDFKIVENIVIKLVLNINVSSLALLLKLLIKY